jgi:hypothetical protein
VSHAKSAAIVAHFAPSFLRENESPCDIPSHNPPHVHVELATPARRLSVAPTCVHNLLTMARAETRFPLPKRGRLCVNMARIPAAGAVACALYGSIKHLKSTCYTHVMRDIRSSYQKCLWHRVGLSATGMMSAGESQRPWWQPVSVSIEIRRTYERRWRRQKNVSKTSLF